MLVRHALEKIGEIQIPAPPLPVEETCASEIAKAVSERIAVRRVPEMAASPRTLRLAVAKNAGPALQQIIDHAPQSGQWAYISLREDGSGEIVASQGAILYATVIRLLEDWGERQVAALAAGSYQKTAFRWHRPLFDYVLTQSWRSAKYVDAEEHIRELARGGYTHIEVNGLAAQDPLETAVPGEFYSQFYAYCIALDQYVSTDLNEGIYPDGYLAKNLNLLKRYAAIGRRYGLEPGMLCFEPRTVPERFFAQYPTLRGARVDHPFRSRLPRYTLSLAHPRVQDHYRQMLQKIMAVVPDLAYLSIWSNDSGAGFEHTHSLYVGRNGGLYMIREWRNQEQIAAAAGRNIVKFMGILRDAGTEINPDFHVSLRLEPFKVEHDVILEHLEERLDIEVPSLLVRGYDLPYSHDKYPDIKGVAGSIQHVKLTAEEGDLIQRHAARGVGSHLIYSQGNGYNFEPLIGLPFPWLIHEKQQAMAARNVAYAANLGGFIPSSLAPYHINQEVCRAFMLEPSLDVDEFLSNQAVRWVGAESASALVAIWKQAETALRWLPPLPLYSHFGFVWLRVWVRPIIPDLHAIPAQDRRYYEGYMVSSDNNTNLVDLGRDVLFDLFSQEYGQSFVERVDANVFGPLGQAMAKAERYATEDSVPEWARPVFVDQLDRLRGLRCWIMTLRSVAAWVAGVYGFLSADSDAQKHAYRGDLFAMMDKEIQNARDLLDLCESSQTRFMVVAKSETSYIYGESLPAWVRRKIELMQQYRDVEPRIDQDILWRL